MMTQIKKGAIAHLPSLGTILDPKLTSPCGARDDLNPLAKYALRPAMLLSFPGVLSAKPGPLERRHAPGVTPSAAATPGLVTRQSLAALQRMVSRRVTVAAEET